MKFIDVLHELTSIKMIKELAVNDLKSRYAGSFFGIIWAIIQPLVTMLVFWYVFQVGFRSTPVDNVPFILWFASAYIPWCFFSDGLLSASNSLYEYNFLIKKIKFPVAALPVVKVCSSLFVHLFFILFLFFLFVVYGYDINLVWLQSLYYTFAMTCFILAVSFTCCSLSVFFKDFSQFINIALQLGFWLTPIFWNPDGMSKTILFTIRLNPMFYIVQGYRDTFIYGKLITDHIYLGAYFWLVTIGMLFVGILVFKNLRPHFADLL